MEQVVQGLWVDRAPLRFAGLELGARMTIVRLDDGRLWVHSPLEATPERLKEVEALGEVGHVVAPNRFHHLHAGSWSAAFPGARLWGAPGLQAKRTDLAFDGELQEPSPFAGLDMVCLQGLPMLNEVVFFHHASSTLIASDLGFNVETPASTRVLLRLSGCRHALAPTWLERWLIRDRVAFAAGMQRVLAWPFERAIVAHGEIVHQGAKPLIASGYAFLSGRPLLPDEGAGSKGADDG